MAPIRASVEAPEECLSTSTALMKSSGYAVPVSKKGYVSLVLLLAREVKDVRQRSEAGKCTFAKREDKVKELLFRLQLFVDYCRKVPMLTA